MLYDNINCVSVIKIGIECISIHVTSVGYTKPVLLCLEQCRKTEVLDNILTKKGQMASWIN